MHRKVPVRFGPGVAGKGPAPQVPRRRPTGVITWYYLAEAAGLEVWLVNARDVKPLPGRGQSDLADCVWVGQLNRGGLVGRGVGGKAERGGAAAPLVRAPGGGAGPAGADPDPVPAGAGPGPAPGPGGEDPRRRAGEDLGGDLGPVRCQRPPVPRCPGRRGTLPGRARGAG